MMKDLGAKAFSYGYAHFPIDLQNAFDLGKRLAEMVQMFDSVGEDMCKTARIFVNSQSI